MRGHPPSYLSAGRSVTRASTQHEPRVVSPVQRVNQVFAVKHGEDPEQALGVATSYFIQQLKVLPP